MTRGTFYFVGKNRVLESIEFNGAMFGSPRDSQPLQECGYYSDAVKQLRQVDSEQSFREAVTAFNDSHSQYDEKQLVYDFRHVRKHNDAKLFDFTGDYFGEYYSDYLYFKNASGACIHFKELHTQSLIYVSDGEVVTFHFGKLIETI